MQAKQLISSTIESIPPDEDGNRALEMMEQFRINHLAIVKNDFFLGVVSDKEIMNWDSSQEYIEEHLSNLASPHVKYDQHLFDIIEVLEKNNLSVVPVLNQENQYQGVITGRKLLYTIAKSATIQSAPTKRQSRQKSPLSFFSEKLGETECVPTGHYLTLVVQTRIFLRIVMRM